MMTIGITIDGCTIPRRIYVVESATSITIWVTGQITAPVCLTAAFGFRRLIVELSNPLARREIYAGQPVG